MRCSATRNRTRRADLADQVHGADVDSQFERSRRDQHASFARFQFPLRFQPQLARQASMVRGHRLFAQAFAQMMGYAFGQTPGVDEDQRRAMRSTSCAMRS